jgi:hypothetical protein
MTTSSCSFVSCPAATLGACCSSTGGCTMTTSATCDFALFTSVGTTCAAAQCPPAGACCDTAGACTFVTHNSCTGRFLGEFACGTIPCPLPGACCQGTSCSLVYQTDCLGAFQGETTTCGPPGNPTTCCPANYDGVNGTNVQDIFAFLAGFFSSDPRADFDHSGTTGIQDIFDFLAAWFVGCP